METSSPIDYAAPSEEVKRRLDALTSDITKAIDELTYDLQQSLLSIADRVEERMAAVGFGGLSGPVVHDIQEGVKAEADRFNTNARSKINEISRAKIQLVESTDELGHLAAMSVTERETMRRRLQEEISASAKTSKDLEEELADAKVALAEFEDRAQAQSAQDAKRIDQLNAVNDQLKENYKHLSDELTSRSHEMEMKHQETITLGQHVRTLQEELAKKERAALEAQSQSLSAAANETRIKSLEDQISYLQGELKKAQDGATRQEKEIAKMQVTTRKVDELQRQVLTDKNQIDESKKTEKVLQTQLKDARSTIAALEKEKTDLKMDQEKGSEQLQVLSEKSAELEKAEKALQTQLKESRTAIVTLERETASLRTTHQKDLEQVQTLTDKNNELEKALGDLKIQIEHVNQSKLDQLMSENKRVQEDKKKLENQLKQVLSEKEDAINALKQEQLRLNEMQKDYTKYQEVKDKLSWIETKSKNQDVLLRRDQHYVVLSNLASKLTDKKYVCTAKELGYTPSSGISLAAWLDTIFLGLEQDGLVVIQRSAGGGMPSATITVTEQGRVALEAKD